MLSLLPLLIVLQAADARPVGVGPAPSPVPIAWEFELRFLDPQRIEVQIAGQREEYWYVVYTVENRSGTTQRFYPTFQIVTEDLNVIDTDLGVSPLVFEAIRERHRITHKYLVHPTEGIGDLRTGDDHALESVAIWRTSDLAANNFTMYVAGLSGETRLVRNPVYDPDSPETIVLDTPRGGPRDVSVNPKTFTLRKTLEVTYRLPGSPAGRAAARPERSLVRWIMR